MNKAYDRLEWDFFEKVLMKLDFAEKWVELVIKCVRSAHYRVKGNGELSKRIKPQRGLRQGDPLSPYLFILAAEMFTILMQEAQEKGYITGLKIAPTAPVLTHLLFADDCIIFVRAKEDEIFQIITVLNEYTKASRQRISLGIGKGGIEK
ncbi:secreted RxLR effector protein 78-like [Arachis hypogaea]|uniref:secreted RxLR effector protein 78-like n=1 Tax=Arachis hypogaea TaxID=3818 RepID=UPI003B21C8AD